MDDSSKLLNDFFSRFTKLTFKKGETIIRAEEEPRGVYYLKKGYARLYALSKNAQELTFIIYKPEDFFPTIWLFNGPPVLYYTEAMTPVEVYQASREEFKKFLENNNKVMFEITKRILTRFGGVLSRMEYAIFGNAFNKVAAILIICAERFGDKNRKGILIRVPLTHQDIANLLGIARETVSIEMKKLQKMGLIDYERKYLIVKDFERLKSKSVLTP